MLWFILSLFWAQLLPKSNYDVASLSQTAFVNGIPISFSILSVSAMPGDTIRFQSHEEGKTLLLLTADSLKHNDRNGGVNWVAPSRHGIYEHIVKTAAGTHLVKVFVMRSLDEIRVTSPHFAIGNYPAKPYNNLEAYLNPRGMIEVTEENQETWVSEHFQLRDFLTNQQASFPKYVIISPKLIYKLELIFQKLNEKKIPTQKLNILSGYRTPYYNGKIGNGRNSRHVYGDAADIFVDNDADQRMDDINQDGKINLEDAKLLASVIDEIDRDAAYQWLTGGMGVYQKTSSHSEFVHTDARGTLIRW